MRYASLLSLLLAATFVENTAMAQTSEPRSPFISAHLGGFVTSLDGFDKVYDTNIGFVFGAGVGLPVSTRMYFYGKATYFAKSGVPVITTYSYQNGTFVSVAETRDGIATFRQWIFNGGMQYNIFLSEDYTLGISGGITYSRIAEDQRNSTGTVSSSISSTGFDFFGGLAAERNFAESPCSVFLETQFNYTRREIFILVGDYGGVNLSLGIRYYFKERRRS